MNREIKFRGQRLDKSEFVYGDLIHGVGSKRGRVFILPLVNNLAQIRNCDPLDGVQVIKESVGQLTGLRDKNGKDLYEGDIVKAIPTEDFIHQGAVSDIFFSSDYQWCVRSILEGFEREEVPHGLGISWGGWVSLEIIGNIYESPELLNQSKQ